MSPIVEDWGRVPYREAWERQKEIFGALIDDRGAVVPSVTERVALVEHDPVYTLGFHGDAGNLLASRERLSRLGAECIRIERGGDITYHGPGQLVVYPMLNIVRRGLGVKKYIELLEGAVTELLKAYGIESSSNGDAIGVWLDWGMTTARKICAIGVKVSHGITMHGLALNVTTDLNAFSEINPCGFTDKGVTSIARELGSYSPTLFAEVKTRFAEILTRRLG